jgi:hypothetical protein
MKPLLGIEGIALQARARSCRMCNPKAALDAVRSLRPVLVLLDLDLPEMDGYTLALLLLRQRDFGCAVIPLETPGHHRVSGNNKTVAPLPPRRLERRIDLPRNNHGIVPHRLGQR